ncbi:PepSY domain-containing protein, partial [Rhizobium johnstonii]
WSIEVTGEAGAIPARFYPSSAHGHHGERMMVWFSPDGTRIVRAEPWGGYLMSWIYQLHMALLAGDPGVQIVGWSGVAMLVLLISGV